MTDVIVTKGRMAGLATRFQGPRQPFVRLPFNPEPLPKQNWYDEFEQNAKEFFASKGLELSTPRTRGES